MSPTEIALGVEDLPSELVLRRLVEPHRHLAVRQVRGLQGEGFLMANLPLWNRIARTFPTLVLLDLDRGCAPGKRQAALPDPHPNLLLRIAVYEVEAWLLADHEAVNEWAGIPRARLPANVDTLTDPKRELVNLVRRHATARLRRFIVPGDNDRRLTAPGYNDALRDLIQGQWNPDRAQTRSPSLARARERIARWRPRIEPWPQVR